MPGLSPWFVVAAGNCAVAAGWVALGVVAWSALASVAFLWMAGLLDDPHIAAWARPYQWWVYARLIGRSWIEGAYLGASALAAAVPFAVAVRLMIARRGGLDMRPFGGRRVGRKIVRGASDNHGHAAWASDALAASIFPLRPQPEYGGLIVGELGRVDLGPVARMPFNSRDPKTWGFGGTAPLMYDHCEIRSTHAALVGGSGTFKTWRLIAAVLGWERSLYCMDPAGEIGDRCKDDLIYRGRKVVTLSAGGSGPNVLDGIDPNDPEAETYVDAILGRLMGPTTGDAKEDKFKQWGREILKAFLCHLIWDQTIPADLKNLRTLRRALEGGDETIRDRLRGIALTSPSEVARSLASTWFDKVKETFDGALLNATGATAWLAGDAYAGLVSDGAYRMSELPEGNLAVFCQVSQFVLDNNPAVARVLTGCHIDAMIRADGAVNGRVWFAVDEAVLMGNDKSLVTALNQGRKYGITLWLLYQTVSQIARMWGEQGLEEFFGSLAWVGYTGFASVKSAKEMSERLGTHAVRATSAGKNRGTSGKLLEVGSTSRGSNTSEHEVSRLLAMPYELLSDMRDDETLTVVAGKPVIRHGPALPFRRPEMMCRLGQTRQEINKAAQLALATP